MLHWGVRRQDRGGALRLGHGLQRRLVFLVVELLFLVDLRLVLLRIGVGLGLVLFLVVIVVEEGLVELRDLALL